MAASQGVDLFERVRRVAIAILLAAGAAGVIGAVFDWAAPERCPEVLPGSTFEEAELEDAPPSPVRGIDAAEGKVVVGASFTILFAAIMLTLRPKPLYAWLAFAAAVVAGSAAIAAYRGIGNPDSSISRRFGMIDAYEVQLGLNLAAAAAVIGFIAAVAAITATPRTD